MKTPNKILVTISTLTLLAHASAFSAELKNRYSFNDTPGSGVATDSVSGANGSLTSSDGSDFSGTGQLTLNGNGGFVALPGGRISTYNSVTIEAWVTWFGGGTDIQRLFDFGGFNGGGTASGNRTYMFFAPSVANHNGDEYGKITKSPDDPMSAQIFLYSGTGPMPTAVETHVVMVFDPSNPTVPGRFYINGVLAASTTYSPAFPLSAIIDTDCFLGRANTATGAVEGTGTAGGPDHWFYGSLNEFRIWNGVLSDAEIAQNFTSGPDAVGGGNQPKLNVALGINVNISWPTNGADGYQLFSTAAISPAAWANVSTTPVESGGIWTVTAPTSGSSKYFRLQK